MVINQEVLLSYAPIIGMETTKEIHTPSGLSYGLTENGYDIRIAQDVILDDATRRFSLASSIEEFSMPANLMAVVHDKSTWARRGVSVFNSVIDSGFKGFLTVEISYSGNGSISISRGTPIAHIIFHEVAVPMEYRGRYQNQENEPVGPRWPVGFQ